jgi:hypothetical protein
MKERLPKRTPELDKIMSYQQMLKSKYKRYISLSETISLWMSDEQKDQPFFSNIILDSNK